MPHSYRCLERFVLFIGQPRSGHSVVGALLNASPDALVAHNLDLLELVKSGATREMLFASIEEREAWFNDRGRFLGGYSYIIPDAPASYDHSLRLIGAKKAGATSRHLLHEPELLAELATCVRLPLACIHHVRNPWDNISSIFQAKILDVDRTLEESIDFYFLNVQGAIRGWAMNEGKASFIRTYHEEMISNPREFQAALYEELGLPIHAAVLEACSHFVHPAPRRTRHSAPWTPRLIEKVKDQAERYDFLCRYNFD